MSNVLIGIIGVILFIGLALAGALFLGPRFQESQLRSEASATTSSIAQVVAAANLYRLNEGRPMIANVDGLSSLASSGYLKTAASGITALDHAGNPSATNPVMTITKRLGAATDERSRKLCEVIDREAGRTKPDAEFNTAARSFQTESPTGTPSQIVGTMGCHSNGANFIAFQRI